MVHDEKHTIVTVTNDDNHKKPHYTSQNTHSKIATTIVVILVLLGITALVLWLLYRPHKPNFTVVGAAVYGVNTTSPPDITAMQFTIVTRNPNTRDSIYYDHLAIFVSNEYRPITPPLMLPPLYHERDSTVALSPIWPITSAVVNGLVGDEVGAVSLRVVLTGRMRWKAGNILRTRRKKVYVGCDVLVGLKRGLLGQVPLVSSSVCRVDE